MKVDVNTDDFRPYLKSLTKYPFHSDIALALLSLLQVSGVNGGENVFVPCVSVCLSVHS